MNDRLLSVQGMIEARRPLMQACLLPEMPLELDPGLLTILTSVMLWPDDGNRRREFILGETLDEQLLFLDGPPELREHPTLRDHLERMRDLFGGWNELLNIRAKGERGDEVKKRTLDGVRAGTGLLYLFWLDRNHAGQLSGRPTLGQVQALMSRMDDQIFGVPTSRSQLQEAWRHFHPVAHLWGAFAFTRTLEVEEMLGGGQLVDWFTRSEYYAPEGVPLIAHLDEEDVRMRHMLVMAQMLQEFGLRFVPNRRRAPLLNSEEIWYLDHFPEWETEFPDMRFPPPLLEILEDG